MSTLKEIKVIFRTITPLWTGDAWQQNNEIRPSSLMGSLRFWFEVICYFSGICEEKHFKSALGRFEEEVNREKLKKCSINNGTDFKTQVECLREQDIPLPSIIFGTTNWKSLIKIKRIKPINGYCFGNFLNLPARICIPKKDKNKLIKKGKEYPKKNKNDENCSFFYFAHPYFYGSFELLFEVEENILESIFLPLLTFMDEYGYWGGKWNLGYGRLKIEKIFIKKNNKFEQIDNWKKEKIKDFKNSNYSSWRDLIEKVDNIDSNLKPFEFIKKFLDIDSFYCGNDRLFEQKKKNIPKKIRVILFKNLNGKNFLKIIEKILSIKIDIRDCLRPKNNNLNNWKNFRYQLLGASGEGSKILPYIDKVNGNIKVGFLSIAGLLNLQEEGENNG